MLHGRRRGLLLVVGMVVLLLAASPGAGPAEATEIESANTCVTVTAPGATTLTVCTTGPLPTVRIECGGDCVSVYVTGQTSVTFSSALITEGVDQSVGGTGCIASVGIGAVNPNCDFTVQIDP